ncbi:MAG: hypothetical protein JXM72_11655 [Deltaproteobacteria bacterium]|nr:hypothetical protein [Deltaproteobacteria bacterium]
MINYLKQIFHSVVDQMLGRNVLDKQSMKSIDFSDIFDKDFDRVMVPEFLKDDFKSCLSMDEYNKDFLDIFQTYGKKMVLNYSQKDGHFRV